MNRDDDDGELLFTHTFSKKTFVVGPSPLTVYVSAEKQNDLDVYVMLRKADANDVLLQSVNQPLSDLGVSTADAYHLWLYSSTSGLKAYCVHRSGLLTQSFRRVGGAHFPMKNGLKYPRAVL
jgi:hypothetical protein